MSLRHSNIHWCSRSLENFNIIDRCGEFPNVPLLGIRGGITYNPCLAFRQFGYARRDGPHEMLIQGVVFDYESDNQSYRPRFIRAWRVVSKVDSKTLGHKNSIPLEPYLRWVRDRAQKLVMPYPSILPGLDFDNLGLISKVVIPHKFKIPVFEIGRASCRERV